MKTDRNGCSRRQFLKAAGAAGVGALLASPAQARPPAADALARQAENALVPTRPFGKSGRQVPILSLGGMFDIAANQVILQQAIQWGVTYWDTASGYQAGSETGIGRYFSRHPEMRESIFLVTKARSRDPEGITSELESSLAKMNTGYIDLYFIHAIRNINEMSDAIRRWGEQAKAAGKVRLFGFSTHSNMEACLMGAAGLGWIDGIMMTYNFRNMNSTAMQAAVAACAEAGIGLTAMKTQAGPSWYDWSGSRPETEALSVELRRRGWTDGQAKLKAVWQNPRIASICSQMNTMRLLKENVDAALAPTALSAGEARLLHRYACATASQYCTGCGRICEGTLTARLPISDVMRCHMYCQSYGKPEWAREQFLALSEETRRRIARADYGEAERRCPQKLPIGRLMRQAVADFG
jgi:uncharacterized protein